MRFRTCPVLAPPRHGPQRQAIELPLSFAPQLGRYSDLTDSTKPPPVRVREQSRSGVGAACRSVLPPGELNPVMFPPGRLRFATKPVPTGSELVAMTIGTVCDFRRRM